MMIWENYEIDNLLYQKLLKRFKFNQIITSLLCNTYIKNIKEAELFLKPKLSLIKDPFEIAYLKSAAEVIIKAIEKNKSILIFGDYDVDGITSIVCLFRFLNEFHKSKINFFVPKRIEEGYGLTKVAINRALEINSKIDLFLILDCGTNSHEEIQYLIKKGIDVIVIDHHKSKSFFIPKDYIIVNPHLVNNSIIFFQELCTIGLVFKLCHGLLKILRKNKIKKAFEIDIRSYLDFVALGTVADMAPLVGENRILVKQGLHVLLKTQNPGLKALININKMNYKENIQVSDILFKLGPLINSSGRVKDAVLPINLFLNDNYDKSFKIVKEIENINKERQIIEQKMIEEAINIIKEENQDQKEMILLYHKNWHLGVVGIVAGKISKLYNRPVFVLGFNLEKFKGSGRSMDGINLIHILEKCNDVINSWGGHNAAVGISIDPRNLNAFHEKFIKEMKKQIINKKILKPIIKVSYWITINDLNENLLYNLNLISPFGLKNPEPIFGIKNIKLNEKIDVFLEKHWRFKLEINKKKFIPGIAWNMINNIPKINEKIDIIIYYKSNSWNRKSYPQIELIDWRKSNEIIEKYL